ncbi:MAG: hypothetical protein ACRDZ4_08470 [Egibacteraceae bacterium]
MESLERALGMLKAEGTLSDEQAAAVRARMAEEASRRRPRVGEAIGYLGGALAVVSALALASQFWADLQVTAQVSMLVLTGLALWAGGRWVAGEGGSPGDRLAGLLWLLSAVAMAGAAGVAADGARANGTVALLAAGSAAVAWGLPLWCARTGALQQLPVFGGIALAVLSGLEEVTRGGLAEAGGVMLWVIGLAWAMLAWGTLVRPRRTGYVLGGLAVLAGAQWLAFDSRGAGLALGAVTAVALLAVATLTAQPVLLGFGTAGVVLFLPQILDAAFPGAISGPAATFIAGVVLLAGGLTTIRTAQRGRGNAR